MGDFTHFDLQGNAVMVDVSEKSDTAREATACGRILMSQECFHLVKGGGMKKGDVLGVARIAGIMGAKKTSELIPLCHIIGLTGVEIEFELRPEICAIDARCTARTVGKTGVEMEALTGVNVALLTIYDMCKAVDKGMFIESIHLLQKSGGKSGLWTSGEEAQNARNGSWTGGEGPQNVRNGSWSVGEGPQNAWNSSWTGGDGAGKNAQSGLRLWGESSGQGSRNKRGDSSDVSLWDMNKQ